MDGGSIYKKGKQNMGAQNFVRQALLDKNPEPESMVRLAGVGHEVPAPASIFKNRNSYKMLNRSDIPLFCEFFV